MASSSDEEGSRSLADMREEQTIGAARKGRRRALAAAVGSSSTLRNREPDGSSAVGSPQRNGQDSSALTEMGADKRSGAASAAAAAAAAAAAGKKPVTVVRGRGGGASSSEGRAWHSARRGGGLEERRTRFVNRNGGPKRLGDQEDSKIGGIGHASASGRASGAAVAATAGAGAGAGGGRRPGKAASKTTGGGSGSGSGRRSGKGNASAGRGGKGKQRKVVTGLLGVPVHWEVGDCDYDDSDDEDFLPWCPPGVPGRTSGLDESLGGGVGGRGRGRRGSHSRARRGESGGGGPRKEGGWITELSREVMLSGVVRAYLDAASKCALQRTCRQMRELIGAPEAWEALDLRADLIGRRTMKSGRQSIMSREPLFFLARSVILQPRFSLVTAVDLRRLNLGAMGSTPDLLVKLFEHCKNLATLNLWDTFIEREDMPQPCSTVEKTIVDNLPGVQNLAIEVDASNKGLKLLVEGCPRLKSLHIGSRCYRKFNCVSLYPNDLGMKVFVAPGAPCLETLSLFDKANIGAAGLRCLLDPSSCPQLKTLILTRMERVNDRCLRSLAPSMGRIASLTLDQCPVKAGTVQFVVEHCPELRSIAVCTRYGIIDKQQEGRPFVECLLSQQSRQLTAVSIETVRMAGRNSTSPWPGNTGFPLWLRHDAELANSVLDSTMPVFKFGRAADAGARIRPFMRMA